MEPQVSYSPLKFCPVCGSRQKPKAFTWVAGNCKWTDCTKCGEPFGVPEKYSWLIPESFRAEKEVG